MAIATHQTYRRHLSRRVSNRDQYLASCQRNGHFTPCKVSIEQPSKQIAPITVYDLHNTLDHSDSAPAPVSVDGISLPTLTSGSRSVAALDLAPNLGQILAHSKKSRVMVSSRGQGAGAFAGGSPAGPHARRGQQMKDKDSNICVPITVSHDLQQYQASLRMRTQWI